MGSGVGLVADLLDPPKSGLASYHDAPDRFVEECFIWPPGQGPTDYQLEILREVVEYGSLGVRGPRSLGKSAVNSWLVLWFSLTREAAGKDWKVATTAASWTQLGTYLWPEIHKWVKRLDWKLLKRPPFVPGIELMKMELRLAHGLAFSASPEDAAKIEGAHADELLFVFDEAKAIADGTFESTEGTFMGAGEDTAMNAYRVASSTPGEPVGYFFDIQGGKREAWTAKHVPLERTIEAGRVSRRKVEQLGREWGVDSQLYINHVLGNFASADEDGLIKLRWVELANERWVEMDEAGWPDLVPLEAVGVDVATTGKDKTVFALRHGMVIRELRRFSKQDEMETAGKLLTVLRSAEHHPVATVDDSATGVISRLREQGANVQPFNHSHHDNNMKDSTGILELHNQRAAAYWWVRELLNPENGHFVALPPDDKLMGDLVTPKHKEHSSGRRLVESKLDIQKRLGRSPDDSDAVVYAFWSAAKAVVSAPAFMTKASRYGAIRQTARIGVGGVG